MIYDPVGGDVFDESVRCIAFDGRLLVIGFTSGRIPSVNVNMPLIKGFSVVGVRAGSCQRVKEAGHVEKNKSDDHQAEAPLEPGFMAAHPVEHRHGRTISREAWGDPTQSPHYDMSAG